MTAFRNLAAAFAMALTIPAVTFAQEGIHVEDAYARVSSENATSGAVYFVIENHGPKEDRLLSAATDAAVRATLHANVEDANGVMAMVPLDEGIAVPGMATHALDRAGDHLMLLGLTRPLREGDTFDLILTFQREGEVRVTVLVDNARKPGGSTMDGMDHGDMAPAD